MPLLSFDGKSDEEIIALVTDNPGYIAGIIERYEEKLRRYLRRISACAEDDLDDMLQEIFIKIYRNSTTFDRRLTASSWIYRIAHNMAVSGWRKRQARPQTIGGAEAEQIWEGIAGDDNPLHTVDAGIMAAAVQTVLKRINHRHRTVLILRYLEDKRYEEISDILQVPPGTVATWLNRAKKEFKKVYTQKP